MNIPNPVNIAAIFGCTVEQAKAQLAKNAKSLKKMADRAAKIGRKVNGYTEIELRGHAARFEEAAT